MEHLHYVRLDAESWITHAFSDAFEKAKETDILIGSGGRQLEINGVINPVITNAEGAPLYRYENGSIVQKEKPIPAQPKLITDSERITILETAIDELMGVVLNG